MLQTTARQVLPQSSEDTVRTALVIRNREGDLAAATSLLQEKGDLNDEQVNLAFLKMLFEGERPKEFQDEILRSILRLDKLNDNPSPEYLIYLLHFSERACLKTDIIDQLMTAARPLVRADEDLKAVWSAVFHRQKFRTVISPSVRDSVTLISLGLHCLPWAMLNRWGLRPASHFHETFNSFSLAIHRLEGVIDALAEDFENYVRTEDLITTNSVNGHAVAARKDRGAVWNHNKGEYWIKNSYAILRENMAWKASNFRASCRRKNPVFMIGNCLIDYPREPLDFLPKLQKALMRHTGSDKNRIVITNQKMPVASQLYRVDETTFFFNCAYPDKQYVWHDDDTADSRVGLIYERNYIGYLRKCLLRWSLVER